jgi:hypothetical protein
MQLIVVTRLVALKSLLLGATSFQLQPPSILTPYHHHFSTAGNTPDSPVGWNLPMQKDSSSSELPSTSPPPPPVMLPFATPGQVKQTLAAYPNSVLLDVRTEDEIVQLGHLHVPGHRWIHTSCTPMACPLLSSTAGDALLPDKQGTKQRLKKKERMILLLDGFVLDAVHESFEIVFL